MSEFFKVVESLLGEFRGYLIGLLIIATIIRIVYAGVKYQNASDDERPGIVKSARNSVFVMLGVYGLIELIPYIASKFSNL